MPYISDVYMTDLHSASESRNSAAVVNNFVETAMSYCAIFQYIYILGYRRHTIGFRTGNKRCCTKYLTLYCN